MAQLGVVGTSIAADWDKAELVAVLQELDRIDIPDIEIPDLCSAPDDMPVPRSARNEMPELDSRPKGLGGNVRVNRRRTSMGGA